MAQVETPSRDDSGEVLLSCSWCSSVFLSPAMLARHWLVDHLQWNSRCAGCGQEMNNSVARHECRHQCGLCHKTVKTRRRLARHYYRAHHTLYCGLCQFTTSSLEEFRDHVSRENKLLESVCILCRSPIHSASCSFKEHLMRSHFGPVVISKPTVFEDKTTNHSEVELITQISLKYKPNKTETYLFDNYSCPHCARKFSAKSGLKIHVGIAHKGGKIIFCSRCPSAFKDVVECKAHFKEEHGGQGTRRAAKRKAETAGGGGGGGGGETHKSLVPTDLPVEGSEPVINLVTGLNNNGEHPEKIVSTEKKKARRPLPGLLKIQDLAGETGGGTEHKARGEKEKVKTKKVILSSKTPTAQAQPLVSRPSLPIMLPQQPLARSALSGQVMTTSSAPPRPILPCPTSLAAPPPPPAAAPGATQVYVPAMTSVGTTILLKLEEAQKHLNNGRVTFLPSASPGAVQPSQEVAEVSQDPSKPDIMREKVALNLPVVMTKRTNKKVAQDNPFYRVLMGGEAGSHLDGVCRSCEAVFSFSNPGAMVTHYQAEHGQTLNINSFPLYYEINYKVKKADSKATVKYFLCHFCGKEFTTKFNVRRHQMLYCVRKELINPRDLGLGKMEEVGDKQEEDLTLSGEQTII